MMDQAARMNSALNAWEADPWNASDKLVDVQFAGFRDRAAKQVTWTSVRDASAPVFGIAVAKLVAVDVEFYATHDGEEMLLTQLAWHGFPDPPEWGLLTRPTGAADLQWTSWGRFAELPKGWKMAT